MVPGDQCCDRKVFGQFLEAFLGNMSRNMEGLSSLARQHAEEMGVKSLGVLDKIPEGAKILAFSQDHNLRIKWHEVDAQLAKIGKPTGFYTVPLAGVLGVRGDKGDVVIRLIDVQQRRLHGVMQYLLDNP